MSRATALLLAGALMVTLAGCSSPPVTSLPLPADDPLPAALLRSLEDRAEAIDSLRGLAQLAVDSDSVRFRRPQRFAAMRPDRLRVEILGLFSQIAAVLVTKEQHYQFFDASQTGMRSGPVTQDLLWEVARIDLSPAEVVELLFGAPPRLSALRLAGAWRLSNGSVRLDLQEPEAARRLDLEFDELGRLRRWAQRDERASWRAGFDDYRDVDGTAFAFEVALYFDSSDSSAVLRFDTVELNPELPAGLFELPTPRSRTALR